MQRTYVKFTHLDTGEEKLVENNIAISYRMKRIKMIKTATKEYDNIEIWYAALLFTQFEGDYEKCQSAKEFDDAVLNLIQDWGTDLQPYDADGNPIQDGEDVDPLASK